MYPQAIRLNPGVCYITKQYFYSISSFIDVIECKEIPFLYKLMKMPNIKEQIFKGTDFCSVKDKKNKELCTLQDIGNEKGDH